MGYFAQDPEAQEYARQVLAALKAAGVRVRALNAILSTHIDSGLLINGPEDANWKRLGQALNKADIEISRGSTGLPFGITVGPKPRD
jgi:uncharacterized lipoprotein